MNYTAQITVRENPEEIQKCLTPEQINRERSSVDSKIEGNKLIIHVEAKDAVAFRATMNALTQAMAVYSKAGQIE